MKRFSSEYLKKHPEMVLNIDDFAGWKINWKDKAQNIIDLVSELNLGLQSDHPGLRSGRVGRRQQSDDVRLVCSVVQPVFYAVLWAVRLCRSDRVARTVRQSIGE